MYYSVDGFFDSRCVQYSPRRTTRRPWTGRTVRHPALVLPGRSPPSVSTL